MANSFPSHPLPAPDDETSSAVGSSVTRGERIVAALLLPAYGMIWAPLVWDRTGPWAIFAEISADVGRMFLSLLRSHGAVSRHDRNTAFVGFFFSLIASTLALGVQALIRMAGRNGFLRGRIFWWWVLAHAGAILAIFVVTGLLEYRESHSVQIDDTGTMLLGGTILSFVLGASALWVGRRP